MNTRAPKRQDKADREAARMTGQEGDMIDNGDKAMVGAIERIMEKTRQREAKQPIQLPLWPEPKRGTPNSFIRSALFAAIQSLSLIHI